MRDSLAILSPFSRAVPVLDLDLQTKPAQRKETHLWKKCPTADLPAEGPTKNQLRTTIMLRGHPIEPMVDERGFPDTGAGDYSNDIYVRVSHASFRKADISSRSKISLPVTGNLAIEIFSGPRLAGDLNVTAAGITS